MSPKKKNTGVLPLFLLLIAVSGLAFLLRQTLSPDAPAATKRRAVVPGYPLANPYMKVVWRFTNLKSTPTIFNNETVMFKLLFDEPLPPDTAPLGTVYYQAPQTLTGDLETFEFPTLMTRDNFFEHRMKVVIIRPNGEVIATGSPKLVGGYFGVPAPRERPSDPRDGPGVIP